MADIATWTRYVEAWRASGQTAAAFCDEHGLGLSALRYWAQRVRRERRTSPQVRLARVERTPTSAASPVSAPDPDTALIVEVGRARITVARGVDRATLAVVLEILGAGGGR